MLEFLTGSTEIVQAANSCLDAITEFVPKVIAFSAMLATALPKTNSSGFYRVMHRVVNALGCNFGHARNHRHYKRKGSSCSTPT